MASISYARAVSAGFRVIGRKPWAVLAWAGAYLVLAALPLILIMSGVLPDVIATYRDAAHNLAHGVAPDAAKFLALRSRMAGVQPLILVVQLVSHTILMGAIFRAVLEPEASKWGYLRVGRQELMLGLTTLVYVLVATILALTLLVPLGIAGAVGLTSAQHGNAPGPMAVPLLRLIELAGSGAIVWAMLRLSLALPMSFAQRRFVLYDSWSLTRGHAFKLFLVALTLVVLLTVCDLIATIGLRTLLIQKLAAAPSWRNLLLGSPVEVARRLTPIMVAIAAVGSLFGMAIYAVIIAPWAEIYRELTADKPADKAA
jgi:hypothetical protein